MSLLETLDPVVKREILKRRFRTDGPLFDAVCHGRLSDVEEILRENPEMNANYLREGHSPLGAASLMGYKNIVLALLRHPGVNPNYPRPIRTTPLAAAFVYRQLATFEVLLADSRVDVDVNLSSGAPLLWAIASKSELRFLRLMVASGRPLPLAITCPRSSMKSDGHLTVLEVAQKGGDVEIIDLLQLFERDPECARHEARVTLGRAFNCASQLFAQMIFYCDGLLSLEHDQVGSWGGRFFLISARMPLELQALLCHRAVGSSRETIPSREFEPAFRSLAATLHPLNL